MNFGSHNSFNNVGRDRPISLYEFGAVNLLCTCRLVYFQTCRVNFLLLCGHMLTKTKQNLAQIQN